MIRRMLIAMSLLATFAVPAVAGDVVVKSASPLHLKVLPMRVGSPSEIKWKEQWNFLDSKTDLPISHALGWDYLKEPRKWVSPIREIHFDWPEPREPEGFDGFTIAG